MYAALKYIHLIAIAMSLCLFVIRYGLKMAESPRLQTRFFRVTPHAVDTMLLTSGLGLMFITGLVPYTDVPWITEKMSGVLAYFALSYFTLHIARNKLLRTFGFLGALGWAYAAYEMAMTKTTFLG